MSKPNNNFNDPNTKPALKWKLWMKFNAAGIAKFQAKSYIRKGFLTDPDQGKARLLRRFLHHPEYRPFIAVARMYDMQTDKCVDHWIVNEDK